MMMSGHLDHRLNPDINQCKFLKIMKPVTIDFEQNTFNKTQDCTRLLWLFGFYGISILAVYLMPNPFLYK